MASSWPLPDRVGRWRRTPFRTWPARVFLAALNANWQEGTGGESFVQQLRQGWDAFRSRTWLWVVVCQFSLFGFFVFPAFFVLGAVIAKDRLGGATAWGIILAAQGAGSVIGTLAMLRITPKKPLLVAELSLLGWMLPLGLLAAHASAVAIGVAGFFAGLSFGVFGPLWDTTMQRELPPDVLSRASAYDWFGSLVLLPVGFVLEGTFAHLLGITHTLVLATVWIGVTTVAVVFVPSVRNLEWSTPAPVAPGEDGPPTVTGHLGVG